MSIDMYEDRTNNNLSIWFDFYGTTVNFSITRNKLIYFMYSSVLGNKFYINFYNIINNKINNKNRIIIPPRLNHYKIRRTINYGIPIHVDSNISGTEGYEWISFKIDLYNDYSAHITYRFPESVYYIKNRIDYLTNQINKYV